ncbi:MAG: hypothetical protein Q8M76_16675 [Spirochaetaceae bacterium]|nr:hypothetical protein [Spirochaetaceae bacterium]
MKRERIDKELREHFARVVAGESLRGPRLEETERALARAGSAEGGSASALGNRGAPTDRGSGARAALKFIPAALTALLLMVAGFTALSPSLGIPARSSLAASISARLPDDPESALATIFETLRIRE